MDELYELGARAILVTDIHACRSAGTVWELRRDSPAAARDHPDALTQAGAVVPVTRRSGRTCGPGIRS